MYLFSIPDSVETRMSNKILLTCMQQHREWFYDDVVIETTYGCPSFCIWNGNRAVNNLPSRPMEILDYFGMYRSLGVIYRLTFTNFLLNEWHLSDTYGNTIARLLNSNGGGYVMVSLPLMALYFRNNYKNLKVCWSTSTEFPEGIKTINTLSEQELVVLPYELNNKWEELSKLEHPENIEVLINEKCMDNCPRRREHWGKYNAYNLLLEDNIYGCFFPEAVQKQPKSHLIPRDKLAEYAEKGINHFKIEGRCNNMSTLLAYSEYLILPEWTNDWTQFYQECNRTNFGKGWPGQVASDRS